MKKIFIYSLVVFTFLVGCGDKESGSIADGVKNVLSGTMEKTKEVADEATKIVAKTASNAVEVVSVVKEVVVVETGDAVAGKVVYTQCVACHGAIGDKKALGTSKVIAGWDVAKTQEALIGYKDGSYGGIMKGVMKGQVVSMSDSDIANISAYILGLK